MIKKINKSKKQEIFSHNFLEKNCRGIMALSQIFILIVGIFAVGYAFGGII